MEDLSGLTISQYELTKKLGRGGMAEVYEAYQPKLDRKVALKIIRPELAVSEGFRSRFEREAKAVARLSHGNIIHVFDFGEQDNRYFMVMEFVEGDTLKDYMQEMANQNQEIPFEVTLSIMEQIGSALDYAHLQGIIHRDVKPDNILLTKDGRAMLSDFGIAKVLDEGENLTITGTAVGTPAYMSPEQIDGKPKDVGAASDIYSLGIILYEMLTGRPPFTADTPLAVMFKHLQDPIPPLRTVKPEFPEAVELVLMKALAKDPEDRYQQARVFTNSLARAYYEGESPPGAVAEVAPDAPTKVSSTPIGAESRTQGIPRWIWIGIIGVIVVLVVVAGILTRPPGASPVSQDTPASLATEEPATSAVQEVIPSPAITDPPSPEPATSTDLPEPSPTTEPVETITPVTTEEPLAEDINERDGAELVFIPEGGFLMGSNPEMDRYFYGAEGPVHPVFLNAYWIYRDEVTNRMYAACVQAGSCSEPLVLGSVTGPDYYGNPEFDDHPVIFVSWEEANVYCAWAGGRLPTEAEWEKAARGDQDERLFPWGNGDPTGEQVNYCDLNCPEALNDPTQDDGFKDTAPVGSFPEGISPYGVMDMAGNVREWTQDWFTAGYYTSSPTENPTGPETGDRRAIRGGSIVDRADGIRVVTRRSDIPDARLAFLGFRCVLDQP